MQRFHSVLVPLDGSRSSDAALQLAATLVATHGRILVAHVIDRATVIAQCVTPYGGTPEPALEALEADERDIFASARTRLDAVGVSFSTHSLDGHVVDIILGFSRDEHVDAIAIGTHGRTGIARLLLGNTAAGIVRATTVPVFVVPEDAAERAARPMRSIVAAVDDSACAAAAAMVAVDIASATHDSDVVFVHVEDRNETDTATFTQATAYAGQMGVRCESIRLRGSPAVAITNSAIVHDADAIAIGARGVHARPLGIGSIAEAVARTSSVPVVVVPEMTAGASTVARSDDAIDIARERTRSEAVAHISL